MEVSEIRKIIDTYEVRCSRLGEIVPKEKARKPIEEQAITQTIFNEIVRDYSKDINSKYLEKGKECEEDSFTMLQNTLFAGKTLIIKNKERKSNSFINGECDTIVKNSVFDIKNAYELSTFQNAELSHLYEWQLVGYSELWNTERAFLYYTLNDMPDHLLFEEEKKMFYSTRKYLTMDGPKFLEDCEVLKKRFVYSNLSLYERFKLFEVEGLQEKKEQIKDHVINFRKGLHKKLDEYLEFIANNQELCEKFLK